MYELLPTNVSVAFYDRSSDWRGKIIKYSTLTDIHHCGIILGRKEGSVVLASDKTHKAKFVDTDRFHKICYQPTHIINMGEHHVSIQQLTEFLHNPYIGDARSLVFWLLGGRYLFPRLLPNSCALVTCYLLRLCGIPVGNHIHPKTLYKEIA